MTTVDLSSVNQVLSQYQDPYLKTDLITAKVIKDLKLEGQRLALNLELGFPAGDHVNHLVETIRELLRRELQLSQIDITINTRITTHEVQPSLKPLPGVKNIIAVASGKGGVGKSTTSVNLALALSADGARVGILDADIYGPSQPVMLGVPYARPETLDGKSLIPVSNHGLQSMSIGYLLEGDDQPMVWRGPVVTQALTQLINDTRWDDLDYLIIDLPPGTGDIQLTLSQRIPVSGAVIVTTPQDIALIDAKKGLKMFEKVHIPVLGIVENMSVFCCPQCGHQAAIFGEGGGERMATEYGTELLGKLPLDLSIRQLADAGKPSVADNPNSEVSLLYRETARRIAAKLSLRAKSYAGKFPKIVIQNN